jgi:Fe2+ or Zn2+ uptake regulation protein
MPISRQEYDDERLNFGVQVLQYLRARNNEAFAADEILYALLEVYERRVTPAEVVVTLEDLLNSGLVESKVIAGGRVYTIAIGSQ